MLSIWDEFTCIVFKRSRTLLIAGALVNRAALFLVFKHSLGMSPKMSIPVLLGRWKIRHLCLIIYQISCCAHILKGNMQYTYVQFWNLWFLWKGILERISYSHYVFKYLILIYQATCNSGDEYVVSITKACVIFRGWVMGVCLLHASLMGWVGGGGYHRQLNYCRLKHWKVRESVLNGAHKFSFFIWSNFLFCWPEIRLFPFIKKKDFSIHAIN